MAILRNSNFWIGVAVGFFVVPFAMKTFRRA